jgi:hypothetical protein
MNTKEMYDEIAALFGAIAKAFGLTDQQAAEGLTKGEISVEMGQDEDGRRFVRAGHEGKFIRVYDGRVLHEGEPPAA